MNEAEMFTFMDVVRGLLRVFPKRLDDIEQQRMSTDYFKALRKFTLPQVQAGADAWVLRGKFFPKPAEWIDAIPRRTTVAVDIPALSDAECADYHRAEKLRYDDAPCRCLRCREAGMTEKALRFVPEANQDGTNRQARDGERIVTAGHWAHGHELARWYEAKAAFYNAYYAALANKGMTGQRMPALTEAR